MPVNPSYGNITGVYFYPISIQFNILYGRVSSKSVAQGFIQIGSEALASPF